MLARSFWWSSTSPHTDASVCSNHKQSRRPPGPGTLVDNTGAVLLLEGRFIESFMPPSHTERTLPGHTSLSRSLGASTQCDLSAALPVCCFCCQPCAVASRHISWQTLGPPCTMALRRAIQMLLLDRRRPSHAPSLSTRPSPTHRLPQSYRLTRVSSQLSLQPSPPPLLFAKLSPLTSSTCWALSNRLSSFVTGILPTPSIRSASPAPSLSGLVSRQEYDALNQEAARSDAVSKRLQQSAHQVQQLIERASVTELYVPHPHHSPSTLVDRLSQSLQNRPEVV